MKIANTKNTLSVAEKKYRDARENTHRRTVMLLRGNLQHLQVTAITPHAIYAFSATWNHGLRRVDWDWEGQQKIWHKRRPSYWEMAIWHKRTLCGLIIGGPSRRRSRLYVEGIEGNPSSTPLKTHILRVALFASEMYAEAIGCREVWVVEPAKELHDLYVAFGYNVRLPNKLLSKVLRRTSYAVKSVGV